MDVNNKINKQLNLNRAAALPTTQFKTSEKWQAEIKPRHQPT